MCRNNSYHQLSRETSSDWKWKKIEKQKNVQDIKKLNIDKIEVENSKNLKVNRFNEKFPFQDYVIYNQMSTQYNHSTDENKKTINKLQAVQTFYNSVTSQLKIFREIPNNQRNL